MTYRIGECRRQGNTVTPDNRLGHTVRDKVLQIFQGQQPAAEPGR
jgi:hypothetical protein